MAGWLDGWMAGCRLRSASCPPWLGLECDACRSSSGRCEPGDEGSGRGRVCSEGEPSWPSRVMRRRAPCAGLCPVARFGRAGPPAPAAPGPRVASGGRQFISDRLPSVPQASSHGGPAPPLRAALGGASRLAMTSTPLSGPGTASSAALAGLPGGSPDGPCASPAAAVNAANVGGGGGGGGSSGPATTHMLDLLEALVPVLPPRRVSRLCSNPGQLALQYHIMLAARCGGRGLRHPLTRRLSRQPQRAPGQTHGAGLRVQRVIWARGEVPAGRGGARGSPPCPCAERACAGCAPVM